MLKQKKTLVLLVAVLIVWGIIGVQIYNYLNPEEEQVPELTPDTFSPIVKKEKETYKVKTHERDPFLGKLLIKPKTTKKRVVKNSPIVFPTIFYNGIVESNHKKAFILTVNNKQKVVNKGETFNEVKLVRGSVKEVTLSYKGKRKVFKIKQ